MASLFHSQRDPDRLEKKQIVVTCVLGVPVVLALAAIVFVSFLTRLLPKWVGPIAFLAEGFAASFVVWKVESLRGRNS